MEKPLIAPTHSSKIYGTEFVFSGINIYIYIVSKEGISTVKNSLLMGF